MTVSMMDKIAARFRSGNSVPVERAHVTAEEFQALNQLFIAALAYIVERGYSDSREHLQDAVERLSS